MSEWRDIANDIEAILTDEHDRHMNRYGFVRDVDRHWQPVRCGERDDDAGTKANAIFNVRHRIRKYFETRAAPISDATRRMEVILGAEFIPHCMNDPGG